MRKIKKKCTPPRVAVIGAGRVGLALAHLLAGAGYPLAGIVARKLGSARRAAGTAGAGRPTTSLRRGLEGASVVLLAVPDRELAPLAVTLADAVGWNGRTVLHTAGASGPEVLASLAARGAAVGTLHPLQTFPDRDDPPRSLRGVGAAVEGDAAACAVARRICRDLGLRPLPLTTGRRATYHLAAVLASNQLVALADAAVEVMNRAGLTRSQALKALLPLMRGTLDGLETRGLPGALTGPVARGDVPTVKRHGDVLRDLDPDLGILYRCLSRRILSLARESGALTDRAARRLTRLLRGPDSES